MFACGVIGLNVITVYARTLSKTHKHTHTHIHTHICTHTNSHKHVQHAHTSRALVVQEATHPHRPALLAPAGNLPLLRICATSARRATNKSGQVGALSLHFEHPESLGWALALMPSQAHIHRQFVIDQTHKHMHIHCH